MTSYKTKVQNKKIIETFQGSLMWVVAVAVLGTLGTWFLFQKISANEESLEKAKSDYQTTLKQLETFDSIKSNFENTKAIKDEVDSMVVKPDSTLSLIEELERAADASSVSLQTSIGEKPGTTKSVTAKLNPFQPSGTANSNTNTAEQEVWLQLTVEGNFSNILTFIKYLENGQKLVSVSTINLDQSNTVSAAEALNNKDENMGYLKAVILVTNAF